MEVDALGRGASTRRINAPLRVHVQMHAPL